MSDWYFSVLSYGTYMKQKKRLFSASGWFTLLQMWYWVQNAGLCCTSLRMTLGPQLDPTAWLRLCSSQAASSAASKGSRQGLKYATTGGARLAAPRFRPSRVSLYVCFWGLKRNTSGFTTLETRFIVAHSETTLDTSERDIQHEDMTTFWFQFSTAAGNMGLGGLDNIPYITFRYHDSQYSTQHFSFWL